MKKIRVEPKPIDDNLAFIKGTQVTVEDCGCGKEGDEAIKSNEEWQTPDTESTQD